MAWGLFRFGLFDVVPVARNRVVEGMDDGVIVVDTHGRVVDLNPAAQRILGYLAFQAAGREAARAFGGWPDLVALCHDETATQAESVWGAGDAQRHYDLRCVLMTDRRGRRIGRKRRDDVDPVQSVQVVEVDDVVLDHLGRHEDRKSVV